ncbi:MAG: peptide chain release factor 2, partial [Saprospiraceae bacterium]
MKTLSNHKSAVATYTKVETAIEDAEILLEFQKEGEATEEEVENKHQEILKKMDELEFRSTLSAPEDEFNAILEINSGAGGTEANDWTYMLFRMYRMWAEKSGFKVSLLSQTDGDVAGIK